MLRAEREDQCIECIWRLVVHGGVASAKLFSGYRAGLSLQEGFVTIGEDLNPYGRAGRVPEVSKCLRQDICRSGGRYQADCVRKRDINFSRVVLP